MKYIILTHIICLFSQFAIGQDSTTHFKLFSANIQFGTSYLAQKDMSHSWASKLEDIDHRLVLNFGGNLSFNPLRKKDFSPRINFGCNFFQSKTSDLDTSYLSQTVSFRNRFFSINLSILGSYKKLNFLNHKLALNAGVITDLKTYLYPFATNSQGETYDRRFDVGTRAYRKNLEFGSIIGADVLVNKMVFGLYYYQRLYFTGFNREISRVMLRVGF